MEKHLPSSADTTVPWYTVQPRPIGNAKQGAAEPKNHGARASRQASELYSQLPAQGPPFAATSPPIYSCCRTRPMRLKNNSLHMHTCAHAHAQRTNTKHTIIHNRRSSALREPSRRESERGAKEALNHQPSRLQSNTFYETNLTNERAMAWPRQMILAMEYTQGGKITGLMNHETETARRRAAKKYER